MRYGAPGATIEAVSRFPSGLVGTLAVRLRDNDGGDAIARTTAGVSADVTVGGWSIYRKDLVLPAVAGEYTIVWDDGTALLAEELVTVTYDQAAAVTPGARDLCTLAEAKNWGSITEVDYDTLLAQLISRASQAIHNFLKREVRPIEAVQPATRPFDIDRYQARKRRLYVRDMAAFPSAIVLKDRHGVTVETVDLDAVIAEPRVREAWQPISKLWLRGGRADSAVHFAPGYTAEVTSTWGFPTIPDDVRHGCIVTVNLWLARDVRNWSGTFNLETNRIERPRALPPAVKDLLGPYRVPAFGNGDDPA